MVDSDARVGKENQVHPEDLPEEDNPDIALDDNNDNSDDEGACNLDYSVFYLRLPMAGTYAPMCQIDFLIF
jgi:hypothetical protein